MSTRLAKVLVFVNLFVGVGLFAWALSLYANRLDYFDRKDADPPVVGRFTLLQDEVKKTAESSKPSYAIGSVEHMIEIQKAGGS